MSTITILPDEVANHIAAGEVIERPASVVKELIENALDALATHITIEIGVGGKAYIRITDNGCGMSPEDARLAFERHATSKITKTADLSSIATLGFRGEALPSIASVSKVKLLTRTEESLVGTRIDIHGGEILKISESGAAPGTYIEVNELFYKTPARLKFLKSPATELSYINAAIMEEALAHPDVGFMVNNNGREQTNLPWKSDLLQRIAGLFGRDLVRELIEVHEHAGSLELRGFIGLPTCHRANRNYQKVFVNNRPVKDKTLSHAILQTYDTLVPKRRYPVVFLFLSLPPELVDVNVHPTKMEIRFVNSQSIHHFVITALRNTLSSSVNKYTVDSSSSVPSEEIPQESSEQPIPPFPEQQELPKVFRGEGSASPPASSRKTQDFPPNEQEFQDWSPDVVPKKSVFSRVPEISSFPTQNITTQQFPSRPGRFISMKPIGQFDDTYLLVQDGENLCIIDQHAAHERIYYERLKQQFQQATLEIQQLLFPVSIELSPREQAALEEYLVQLNKYGLELEHFGGATYLLKAVPALLAKTDHKKLLYDIIDRLVETEKATTLDHIFDEILILMSCHAAIRAHQPLQHAQIFALLQQMDAAEYPYTCPHGRPTIIKINVRDLEKKFGRG